MDSFNSIMLLPSYFDRDPIVIAKGLLGKVIHVHYQNKWLRARIILTEAYYLEEKASHASLGYTDKRRALFMPAGTIYMYYARGGDSLNISCRGEGNAVLIKSAYPYAETETQRQQQIRIMQKLNPTKDLNKMRSEEKLCNGQTLLCRSLNLKVPEWNTKLFDKKTFYIADLDLKVRKIIQTTRLGIPKGRDEELPYRFIDQDFNYACSKPVPLRLITD